MVTLHTVLLVVQVLVAICLIGFILIQHGKGADAGAAFGSGASATVFGARGSGNFFSRATAVLALVFMVNCLLLAYIATERIRGQKSLMEGAATSTVADPATVSGTVAGEVAESETETVPQSKTISIPLGDDLSAADSVPADDAAPAQEQSDVPAVPQQ